ncbi:MAG TPA: MazG-like family protein [Limnochordia bacterium]|nr:MazG-like family protein [Limnochordia bacterium]
MKPEPELDIAGRIKTIEWLKTELVSGVGLLFRAMFKGGEALIADSLANLVLTLYVLGRRLGVSYAALDRRLDEVTRDNLDQSHEVERWYGDLSELAEYLRESRK